MKKITALLFACTSSIALCATAALKETTRDQLKKGLAEKTMMVVDANTDSVRAETGYIPGAILQGTKSTSATKDLPKDKKMALVFYCYNQQCTASHMAANSATSKGHKNVSIFSDGIEGWIKAGEAVEKLTLPK